MDFAFSDEQEELRRTVHAFLRDKSPEAEVRRLMETDDGYDPAVWRQMAEQLGLQALRVPEEYGGVGFGWLELGVVLEEMGRALLCAPYFSTAVLATETLLRSGDEPAKKELLPGIAAGTRVATLAFVEPGRAWHEPAVDVTVRHSGHEGDWRLTGRKTLVLDGHTADLLLVTARGDDGVGLYAVDAGAAGLTRTPLDTLDATRKLAHVDLADTPARPVGDPDAGARVLAHVLDVACVALAMEQVGGAQQVLDTAVGYAKERVQFGRPIGSFQAVKHTCADMFVDVESARSAAYYALWAAAAGSPELPAVASLAKACCSEAYVRTAHENIQVHGGLGFTWEHPAHLYFRRATSSRLLFGDPDHHRELLVQRVAG